RHRDDGGLRLAREAPGALDQGLNMPRKVEIAGLGKWVGEVGALRGIDMAVEQGEFISVVGPSGCGKTTFLRMVAGLEPTTSGSILLDGQPLRGPGNKPRSVFANH